MRKQFNKANTIDDMMNIREAANTPLLSPVTKVSEPQNIKMGVERFVKQKTT